MAGSIPFDSPSARPSDAGLASTAPSDERTGMERVMADLATAFALNIDPAQTTERHEGEKWLLGWTVWFVVLASAALWAAIIGFVVLL